MIFEFSDDEEMANEETIPVESFGTVRAGQERDRKPEIEPCKPRVLKTSLSNEDEARLKAAPIKVA